MRQRSTGLGNTELEAVILDIKRVEDVLMFYVDITKPVKWHTRMAFQEKDLRVLIRGMLKPRNLWYIARAFFANEEKLRRTEKF